MTLRIGFAGRRAREFARARMGFGPAPASGRFPTRGSDLPLLQRAMPAASSADEGYEVSPPAQAGSADTAVERETTPPSPEEIADRVYRLFYQDWRLGRERRGGG
ncbi:MAG: hypothetical protein GXP41_11195 [Chloroflexi bacterium]|nr:hypothetical protein [Chloroflexota bacterium]